MGKKESEIDRSDQFNGLVEGVDYVRCRICGKKAVSLTRHLVKEHNTPAVRYRELYGAGALVFGSVSKEKRGASRRGKSHRKVGKRLANCPNCGESNEVPYRTSPFTKCLKCKGEEIQKALKEKWDGKSELHDYVTCLECGHKSESLASHIQRSHPELSKKYRDKYPGASITAKSFRSKLSAQSKGKPKTEIWKKKFQVYAESQIIRLTLKDLTPYIESDGTVDHHSAVKGLGVGIMPMKRNIQELGLRCTRKYSLTRSDYKKFTLRPEDFDPYRLKNGKVAICKAVTGLGHCHTTLQKICIQLGLPIAHRAISQELFLDAVSRALGGLAYEQEWNPPGFLNPKTGGRLRYDGYFPDHNLLAEFQGWQHTVFPSTHIKNLNQFRALQERDKLKERLTVGVYLYLVVHYNDPWEDLNFLQDRLNTLGLTP
jgi:predicted transcriptional regulator